MILIRRTRVYPLICVLCLLLWKTRASTDLGGGLSTRSDVKNYLDLTQDLSSIQQLIEEGQPLEALGIYKNGQHAESSSGVKLSLSHLADELAQDPTTVTWLFQLYGLHGDLALNINFDTHKLNSINNVIEQTFQTNPTLAVEAILILNLWMYSTHLWYSAVNDCRKLSQADNPDILQLDPLKRIDQFMALWVGAGQTVGRSDGFSLYSWVQTQAVVFETLDGTNGEAFANSRIKLWYSDAASLLAAPNACSRDNETLIQRLWALARTVVQEMSKPLLQGLLDSIADDINPGRSTLYAQAVMPQLSQCRPSIYEKAHQAFVQENGSFSDFVSEHMDDVPEWAGCFGYSCRELGTTRIDVCDKHDRTRPVLAGFVPSTPIGNVAFADLDVYQMDILLSVKATDYAQLVYLYGGNIAKPRNDPSDSISFVSLHEIAVSSERSSAQDWFDVYTAYHQDKNYANSAIQRALSDETIPSQERGAYVTAIAAYQILFMEAISKLYIALSKCRSSVLEMEQTGQPVLETSLLNPIDEAAALLIGSMEGPTLGGSEDLQDGQLVYNIANRHALEFGTQTSQGSYSIAVSEIENKVYAAKGAYESQGCDNLESSIESIIRYSMVGVFQDSIQLAFNNEKLQGGQSPTTVYRSAALADVILPLVAKEDSGLENLLQVDLKSIGSDDHVGSGAFSVAGNLGYAFQLVFHVPCSDYLGSLPSLRFCPSTCSGSTCPSSNGGSGLGDDDTMNYLIKWIVIALSVVSFAVAVAWYFNRDGSGEKERSRRSRGDSAAEQEQSRKEREALSRKVDNRIDVNANVV